MRTGKQLCVGVDVHQMRVRHSAAAAGYYMCLCITNLAAGVFRKEEDANQQEVKLSTQQQDSGPEVSRVTCQTKEITTNQRLHSCTHQWTVASKTHCQHS